MQIYIELALAENFCMDFCLLYGAKLATKNLCSFKKIALSSAIGAAFAVVAPLIKLPALVLQIIKILFGFILCVICAKFNKAKPLIKFVSAFYILTFLTGGILCALFAFFNISYTVGGGFYISSVPVAIPIFFVLIIVLAVKALADKYKGKIDKIAVKCRIFVGQFSVEEQAFFDSGNKVYCFGQPVSIISESAASQILKENALFESVKIHTVAGSKIIKVFTADKIEIITEDKVKTVKKVKIGISPTPINSAVLHPDLSEVN